MLGETDANGKARALTLATGIDDPSCTVDWRCADQAHRPRMVVAATGRRSALALSRVWLFDTEEEITHYPLVSIRHGRVIVENEPSGQSAPTIVNSSVMDVEARIEALMLKAETGADWAEICRIEAEELRPLLAARAGNDR